jgi:hypothetical protein
MWRHVSFIPPLNLALVAKELLATGLRTECCLLACQCSLEETYQRFATTTRLSLYPTTKPEAADCFEMLLKFYQASQRQSTTTVPNNVPTARICNLTFYNYSAIIFRESGYRQRTAAFFGVLGKVIPPKYNEESQHRHLHRFMCSPI